MIKFARDVCNPCFHLLQSSRQSTYNLSVKRFLLPAAWLLAVFVVFVTLGPASDRPRFGYPQIERFSAYFLLSSFWSVAYPKRPWLVLAGLACGAVLLEGAQALAPGRDAGLVDVSVKVAGVAVGSGLAAIARRWACLARSGRSG